MEIMEVGGEVTVTVSTIFRTVNKKFRFGEGFEETTTDGRDVKTCVIFEDGKIVSTQIPKKTGQKSTRSVRELNGPDELVYTITTLDGQENVAWVQRFKRITLG